MEWNQNKNDQTNIDIFANHFIPRAWIFQKVLHCIVTRNTARTCGVLILGGSGSGKTTICKQIIEKNPVNYSTDAQLKRMLLSFHKCSSFDVDSLNLSNFILNVHNSIISNEYFSDAYKEYLQSSNSWDLFSKDSIIQYPDKVFKNGILLPLLSFSPPNNNMFILIDSIDENFISISTTDRKLSSLVEESISQGSQNISDLISAHHNFIPDWLSIICTCRRDSMTVIKKFTGFRKFNIDDLSKSSVIRDIQFYILTRIDSDLSLKKIINQEADILNILHIKSNGYILYLQIILDLIGQNVIQLKSLKNIPGTLSGLYLYIFETVFSESEELSMAKHIFSIILSSPELLTEQQIFNAVLHFNSDYEFYYIKSVILKIKYFLIKNPQKNSCHIKHISLAEWLLDVKMSTPKYKCSLNDGHAILSLYYTQHTSNLNARQFIHFVLHLIGSCSIFQLKGYHIAAWILYSDFNFTSLHSFGTITFPDKHLQKLIFFVLNFLTTTSTDSVQTHLPSFMKFCAAVRSLNKTYLKRKTTNVFNDSVSLHDAVRKNDYNLTSQLLLNQAVSVDKCNSNGTTPLMIAAQNGYCDLCRLLLSNGAQKDVLDKDDWTPLRLAIWSGHKNVVEILLDVKSDPDFCGRDNRTALRTAAWVGNLDVALLLLSKGAVIDKADSEGRTALMAATYRGHKDMVEYLLRCGANVNHRDNDGRNALFVAVLCLNLTGINNNYNNYNNSSSAQYCTAAAGETTADYLVVNDSSGSDKLIGLEIIDLLLQYGSELNTPDLDGMTPLSIAAYEGNVDLCEMLLDYNADVDFVDRNSRTPLMAATLAGHLDVVQLLLFWGAAIHCLDKNGFSVLSVCAAQGHPHIMQELLARGLDEMHRDNRGHTPLHIAALEGHLSAVKLLLQAGSRPSETDDLGRIPLMLACQEGHSAVVQHLLGLWHDSIDYVSFDGSTPLKVAILNEWRDVVVLLLDMGADITLLDNSGRSPLHISVLQASYECFSDVLLFMKNYHPEMMDLQEENGRTALHLASWKGDVEMVFRLLQAGLRHSVKDEEGRTPLHLGAWRGHLEVCRVLLRFHASVDDTCLQGATALCVAAQEGHLEICDLLIKAGANIYHGDDYKRTPYKVAYKGGHTKICKILEKNGALLFLRK